MEKSPSQFRNDVKQWLSEFNDRFPGSTVLGIVMDKNVNEIYTLIHGDAVRLSFAAVQLLKHPSSGVFFMRGVEIDSSLDDDDDIQS